jgi:signal transduction histidine kinase
MISSSLRARVTFWYLGLLAAALVSFAACIYVSLQRYLQLSLERSLSTEARNIAGKFVDPVEAKGKTWLSDELSESYPPDSSGEYIRVSRLDAAAVPQVLYESPGFRALSSGGQRAAYPFLANQPYRTQTTVSGQQIVIYNYLYKSDAAISYLVETGTSRLPIDQLLEKLLAILLVLTPLILVAAAVGGYFLMAQPLRPLVSLTDKAERIGTGEPGERLPVIATGDELESLSHSLNRMISRLENALSHNRRFTADVSHELRTPLTILRGELDHVMQMQDLPPEIGDSVGSALEEIERLARIVESLLAISHLDSGGAGIEHNVFDLHATAVYTADQMRLLAEEKHILLVNDTVGPVYTVGDESRIKQVLVNLLDNAIKYTPENGRVATSVRSEGSDAVLTVIDNGIGIPADSLAHIFERFYRADGARSRLIAGVGLGLPIVQAICRAHGGFINITSTDGQGTSVEVRLPLAEAPGLSAEEEITATR